MKNKEIFSLADAFDPSSSVVHSSLSDFAPSLARDAEFPSFPAKLGVITRFRETRTGYVAAIETEWPALTSTTRGELVLCSDAEQITREKTQLLIGRCETLAQELVNQADRLRNTLKSQKLIHSAGVNPSQHAESLDDSGKTRAWEIDGCDRQERKEPREPRAERRTPIKTGSFGSSTSKPETSRGVAPGALSAILADDDGDD